MTKGTPPYSMVAAKILAATLSARKKKAIDIGSIAMIIIEETKVQLMVIFNIITGTGIIVNINKVKRCSQGKPQQ